MKINNRVTELLNIEYPFSRGVGMPEVVRLYPHEQKGEGQFVAVLKKLNEKERRNFTLKLWKQNKWKYLEFKYHCHTIDELTDFYIAGKPNLDPKYILSNAYKVNLKDDKIKIYLKKGVKKYNIVERNVATHVLIQNFDKRLNLISQKVYILKIKKS